MSNHECDICGRNEYEYKGSRAEYNHSLYAIFGDGYDHLCEECKEEFLGKVKRFAGFIAHKIRQRHIASTEENSK